MREDTVDEAATLTSPNARVLGGARLPATLGRLPNVQTTNGCALRPSMSHLADVKVLLDSRGLYDGKTIHGVNPLLLVEKIIRWALRPPCLHC